MIDVHVVKKKKTKQNKKKVHRFLNTEEKKMIDMHTVNQKKAKKVHRFLQYERKK